MLAICFIGNVCVYPHEPFSLHKFIYQNRQFFNRLNSFKNHNSFYFIEQQKQPEYKRQIHSFHCVKWVHKMRLFTFTLSVMFAFICRILIIDWKRKQTKEWRFYKKKIDDRHNRCQRRLCDLSWFFFASVDALK